MEHIGIDLHKTSSQICILSEDGESLRHVGEKTGRNPLRDVAG